MITDLPGLRQRLGDCLGTSIERLQVLDTGWETTIYEFSIGAKSLRTPGLPVASPLVLRLYDGTGAEDKAAREGRIFFHLARAGYPVPRPYVCEPARATLGAPFLVMDRVAGGPLFSATNFTRAFKTFSLGFLAFVRAQVRLHRLPVGGPDSDDLPKAHLAPPIAPTAPLLERMLGMIAERVAGGALPGLIDALAALRERADRYRTAPDAIVHLDYHPQNVIVRGMRVTGVIDWVSADRGDRHLDAATTSAILATSAMDRPRWMRDNRAGNSLRALFASLYFPAYHALAPMELDRFRYCQAVAALFRLSTFGMMRTRGPASVGFHPEAIANVTPDVVRLLTRYAARKSGVAVTLDR